MNRALFMFLVGVGYLAFALALARVSRTAATKTWEPKRYLHGLVRLASAEEVRVISRGFSWIMIGGAGFAFALAFWSLAQ